MSDKKRFRELLEKSNYIVFFGGAGVSTESNIPDFRSVDGLYNQNWAYPPETILSHGFFIKNPEEFYRFYYEKILIDNVEPNKAHYALAKLEKMGKLKAIVTQNIDGLHQMAGSRAVYELHGTVLKNHCTKCHKAYDSDFVKISKPVPLCRDCGGIIKPDVVLYGEGLDMNTVNEAVRHISNADLLIVGGTSLVVYPAASLVNYYRGDNIVLINKDYTGLDNSADIIFRDKIGEVLAEAVKDL